jgi:hypothetical protein
MSAGANEMTDKTLPAVASAADPTDAFTPAERAELQAAMADLLPRQVEFVRAYLATGNGSAAARAAGYGGGRGGRFFNATAYRLLRQPKVVKALAIFKTILSRHAAFDFDRASSLFMEGLDFARSTQNATAFVRGAELLAKLHGHLTDKVDLRAAGAVAFVFPERREPAKVIDYDD